MDKITSKKGLSFVLACPVHPGEQITRSCTDLSCSNQSLYCPQCEKLDKQHSSDHRNKIRPISEFLAYLSKEIEKFSTETKTTNTFLSEDSEKILKTMSKHLKEQKLKVEKDFKRMLEGLIQIMTSTMNETLKNMDIQYETFARNYEVFKGSFSHSQGSHHNPYQNFANSHNLVSKLKTMNSIKDQSQFLSGVKKFVNEKQIAASAFKSGNDSKSNKTTETKEIFRVEDLIKKQIKDPPTYNTPNIELISDKLKKFAKKMQKIFENHIFFYPLKSAMPFLMFRGLKFPQDPQNLNFEIVNENKGVVLELDNLRDFIQLTPLEPLQTNHEKPIQSIIALSHEVIATGGADNVIKLWDMSTKKLLKNLFGNTSNITGFSLFHLEKTPQNREIVIRDYKRKFSEYGFLLINASTDKNIVVWDSDFDKSTVSTQFKMIKGHDYNISCLQEMHNGENIITGDEKGFIIIWNILEHKSVFKSVSTKTSHRRAVSSINLIDKFKRFITSDLEGVLLIWEISYQKSLKTGLEVINDCRIVHAMKDNYGAITNVVSRTIVPNVLISAHDKGKIVVWTVSDDSNKIKSHVLIDDIQDSIHQISVVELKEKPKEFAVLCLLSQKHGVCVVDAEGKITAAIKFGTEEDLVSNSVNPNYKFQFIGKKKPVLIVANQSREKRTVNVMEINV